MESLDTVESFNIWCLIFYFYWSHENPFHYQDSLMVSFTSNRLSKRKVTKHSILESFKNQSIRIKRCKNKNL